MKIKQEVLERIQGRAKDLKPRFCDEMGISIQAVNYALKSNRNGGWLTSVPIVKIIGEVLNLAPDQILTHDETLDRKRTHSLRNAVRGQVGKANS